MSHTVLCSANETCLYITPGDSSIVEVVGLEKRFRHTAVIITPISFEAWATAVLGLCSFEGARWFDRNPTRRRNP